MKLMLGMLALAFVLPFAAQPASATGALAGVASINLQQCPPDTAHFFATNVDSNIWKFQIGVGCTQPKLLAMGSWDPTVGGCVPGDSFTGKFCLGALATGIPTFTTATLCINTACQTGSATALYA